MAQTKLYDPFYGKCNVERTGKLKQSSSVNQVSSSVANDPVFLKSGPRSKFYLLNDPVSRMRRRAYEFAYMEFKKRIVETKFNAGPGISEPGNDNDLGYLQVIGMPPGPKGKWGGAFAAWCYYNAGLQLPSFSKNTNLAYARTWRLFCQPIPKNQLHNLQPGDIVCLGDSQYSDHVAMFSMWIDPPGKDGHGLFSVIEGNSALDKNFKITKHPNGRYTREAINVVDPAYVAGRRRLYPTEHEDGFGGWFMDPLRDPDLYDIEGGPNSPGGTHDPNLAGNRIWQNCWAVDMYVNEGTPVYACMDGIVASAGEGSGGRFEGAKVGVVGTGAAKGYLSFSTHMKEIFVSQGDQVKKGQKIGLSGVANEAAHLHFAMAKGTFYTDNYDSGIDPRPYIKSAVRKHDDKPLTVGFYRLTRTSLSESDFYL